MLERHGELIVERVNRLIEVGYRPIFLRDLTWIEFEHPTAPHVSVWSDGQVVDRRPRSDTPDDQRIIIRAEDEASFAELIARTPAIPWSEKLKRTTLIDAWWIIVAWSLLIAWIAGGSWIGNHVWVWLRGS